MQHASVLSNFVRNLNLGKDVDNEPMRVSPDGARQSLRIAACTETIPMRVVKRVRPCQRCTVLFRQP